MLNNECHFIVIITVMLKLTVKVQVKQIANCNCIHQKQNQSYSMRSFGKQKLKGDLQSTIK